MRRSNGQQVLTKYSMGGKGEEEEIWLNFVGTCMEECLQRDNGSALTSNSNRYSFIALPYTSDSFCGQRQAQRRSRLRDHTLMNHPTILIRMETTHASIISRDTTSYHLANCFQDSKTSPSPSPSQICALSHCFLQFLEKFVCLKLRYDVNT
jgi:hypothetical protein